MKIKTIRNLLFFLALILLSGGIGYRLGNHAVSDSNTIRPVIIGGVTPAANVAKDVKTVDFSLFWDVWGRLRQKYINKSAFDAQKMVYGAISGMVASLDDPYTVFLPPQENKEAKDELGGQFEGIGAQLGIKDKRIVVIAPLSGMPAESAGLLAGDWIIKVDGKETGNWTLPKAVLNIRGPKGTTVTLTILHENDSKPVDIKIVRSTIHVPSVEWRRIEAFCNNNLECKIIKDQCPNCIGVAYIKLSRFGDQTVSEWNTAVDEISRLVCGAKNPLCKGVVLDLRNNPGGYLQGSVYVGSEFLKNGVIVIQDNSDGTKQTLTVNHKGKLVDVPLTVLVNKGSASASEIVAGALKVRKRALVVGEQTFGKGSVQESEDLVGGAGLHITVAHWLLPDGTHLNGDGVEPDVTIEPLEASNSANRQRDVQLEKSIEVLLNPKI